MKKVEREKVLLGILGAIIGSVFGAAAIILLGWIGFMASFGGVILAAGTLYGYKTLGGKLSVKGIVISVLVMIVMTYISERMVWSIGIYRELIEEYDEVSLAAIFFNFISIIAEFGLYASFAKDLVMLYIFTVLGAFPTIKKNYVEKKDEVSVLNDSEAA